MVFYRIQKVGIDRSRSQEVLLVIRMHIDRIIFRSEMNFSNKMMSKYRLKLNSQ